MATATVATATTSSLISKKRPFVSYPCFLPRMRLWLSVLTVLSQITVCWSLVSGNNKIISSMTDGGENVTDDESTRETLRPWSDRWKNKRIGFHLSEVNPVLTNHATALLPSSETCDAAAVKQQASSSSSSSPAKPKVRIFVPLCGKAVDMAYLATSVATSTATPIEVVGLEGIRLALEEFIEEHPGLGISREAIPSTNDVPFERFEGDTVSLWKGDYFDLSGETTTTTAIGRFEAIYDRASIVAIEPELREDYVEILDGLLVPGGRILLVALERVVTPENASAGKRGPPYSIPEATLRGLFASLGASYNVAILKQTDQLVEKPEDRERYPDLEQLLETVYLIQKDSA